MTTRLSEFPFKLRASTIEGAANTFAESDINLPVAIVRGGKVQAVEVMKHYSRMAAPDSEDAQNNTFTEQWTRDSQTALLALDSDQVISQRRIEIDNSAINGSYLLDAVQVIDLTDGDGNGELLLERSIHHGVAGTGNAAAKRGQGWLLAHLIEVTGEEAAVQMFIDDS